VDFSAAHRRGEEAWLAQAVRAHDRVIRRVFSQVPMVPVRFGRTFAGRAGVAEFLHRRADHLRGSLEHVGDSAEWIVEISTVDTSDPPEPGDGKAAMRHRRAAVLAQQHQSRLVAQAPHPLADAGLALRVSGPLPAYHSVLDAKLA
jgi:hypothetical protein